MFLIIYFALLMSFPKRLGAAGGKHLQQSQLSVFLLICAFSCFLFICWVSWVGSGSLFIYTLCLSMYFSFTLISSSPLFIVRSRAHIHWVCRFRLGVWLLFLLLCYSILWFCFIIFLYSAVGVMSLQVGFGNLFRLFPLLFFFQLLSFFSSVVAW